VYPQRLLRVGVGTGMLAGDESFWDELFNVERVSGRNYRMMQVQWRLDQGRLEKGTRFRLRKAGLAIYRNARSAYDMLAIWPSMDVLASLSWPIKPSCLRPLLLARFAVGMIPVLVTHTVLHRTEG
jgi:hypothetical protein